jgi:hypothetical protein
MRDDLHPARTSSRTRIAGCVQSYVGTLSTSQVLSFWKLRSLLNSRLAFSPLHMFPDTARNDK